MNFKLLVPHEIFLLNEFFFVLLRLTPSSVTTVILPQKSFIFNVLNSKVDDGPQPLAAEAY